MIGLVLPIAVATLLALLLGGSLAGWARQRVYWSPLILAAFAIQLVLFNPPLNEQPWAVAWGAWVWVATMLTVAAALLRNALAGGARVAWLVATLGVALNLLVVVANGGQMPRAPEAAAVANSPTRAEASARLSNVAPIAAETNFVWLSDVIPQPAWLPMANVMSVGDVLLAAGAALWSFQATTAVRRQSPRLG
jgi:hypothetical protein